ncbi:hypothetical protein HanPI659440_Chr08g0285001 [Helianthus annuus]|nr:hypothetical protein HanPI659440_Chr08g0285001 [Helianthus annuus]
MGHYFHKTPRNFLLWPIGNFQIFYAIFFCFIFLKKVIIMYQCWDIIPLNHFLTSSPIISLYWLGRHMSDNVQERGLNFKPHQGHLQRSRSLLKSC